MSFLAPAAFALALLLPIIVVLYLLYILCVPKELG